MKILIFQKNPNKFFNKSTKLNCAKTSQKQDFVFIEKNASSPMDQLNLITRKISKAAFIVQKSVLLFGVKEDVLMVSDVSLCM